MEVHHPLHRKRHQMILTCFDHFDLYFSDLFTFVDLSHVQMCQIRVQMTSKSFPIPHVLPPPWGPGALGPCLSRISPPRWVQHGGSFHLRRTRCPRSLTRRRVVGRTPPPCHGKVSPVETNGLSAVYGPFVWSPGALGRILWRTFREGFEREFRPWQWAQSARNTEDLEGKPEPLRSTRPEA